MMRKSPRDRFEDFLADSRDTRDAINELVNSTNQHFAGYGYATGYLSTVLGDVISELPRARRDELRSQLRRKAQEYAIKEAA